MKLETEYMTERFTVIGICLQQWQEQGRLAGLAFKRLQDYIKNSIWIQIKTTYATITINQRTNLPKYKRHDPHKLLCDKDLKQHTNRCQLSQHTAYKTPHKLQPAVMESVMVCGSSSAHGDYL